MIRFAEQKVVPLPIEITAEAAISGAISLATEAESLLAFNAMRKAPDGSYESAGCAIVRFQSCPISKFGYPNDEAWAAIPRTKGLDYGGYEVLNSGWNAELSALNRHAFPRSPKVRGRHFLFLFHDSSFECLAEGFSLELASWEEWERVALAAMRSR